MATTDPELVSLVLAALDEAGIRLAVLHHEPAVARGQIASDIDIAVDRPVRSVVAVLRRALYPHGRIITLWRYDISGTALFIVRPDVRQGVQIDVLYDPDAIGKYGVRTNVLLARRVSGERWPRPHRLDELLYLASKRRVKGDAVHAYALLDEASRLDGYRSHVRSLLSPAMREALDEMRHSRSSTGMGLPSMPDVARIVDRVLRPAGFWVELMAGAGMVQHPAQLLGQRLERILPWVHVSAAPPCGFSHASWWLRTVVPTRWRPGVAVTWGEKPCRPKADLILGEPTDVDDLADRLTEAMSERVARRMARPDL